MFYLDLDEIDDLDKKVTLLSRNRFNMFNFKDRDHLVLSGRNVKENIHEYLSNNGITSLPAKIMLLTNLRTMGYVFNPVSFYFCFDDKNNPECIIAEVGNTFGEMKPYLLRKEDFFKDKFQSTLDKMFYVSPFIDLDISFEFKLSIPDKRLNLRINDFRDKNKFFLSSLTGVKRELSNASLFRYAFKYPFITVKIISAIHYQAFKLYRKKLFYHKKDENPQYQKGVYQWHT